MLPFEPTPQFSDHSSLYDLLVPKTNLLRQINDLIDFSFIRSELLQKYSLDNGRTAESPVRMFKYLLLKIIHDLSDVDVVEHFLYDLSYKYFLGMVPEETSLINPGSLSKFRKLRLKDNDLMDLLIRKTVNIAVEKGIIKSKTIIVDSTHTCHAAILIPPVDVLKLRAKQLRKSLYDADEKVKEALPAKNEDNNLEHEMEYTRKLIETVSANEILVHVPKMKERLNMLKEVLGDIEDHYTTSKDTDARVGHKSEDDSFFGFRTHIAMSDERIITAATVTSGEKGDGPELENLVEKSRANGMEVDTVVGDTAYSGKDNIILSQDEEKGFELVARLHPTISHGFRKKEDEFDFNKDACMFVCPAGHMAIRKARQGKKNQGQNRTMTCYFDVDKCRTCSRRNGCYKEGTRSKTYSVSIKSEEYKRRSAFQDTDEFKRKAAVRYKIEAKNAELKNVSGYDKATSYGIDYIRMQGALIIFVANLKITLR